MAVMVRARIRVVGIVQGVAFRQSRVDEARRLGLAGHVRNLADGSVEAEAEGARAEVEAEGERPGSHALDHQPPRDR